MKLFNLKNIRFFCKNNLIKNIIKNNQINKLEVDILENNVNDKFEQEENLLKENLNGTIKKEKFKNEVIYENIQYNNNIIDSKFGRWFIINENYNKNNKIIHYITSNISSRYIKRLFLHSPNCVILFGKYYNYKNLFQLYNSIKKFVNERYYGKPGKLKNPFKKCKNNKEIYHLSRKINNDVNLFLNNLNIIVDYNYNILWDQFNFKLDNLKDVILEIENKYNKNNLPKYFKHDYIIPFRKIINMISNNNFEKKGINLKFFSEKKFISINKCWPPTQTHLYRLFYESIKENTNFYLYKNNFLDIGCGSGVLSIIAADLIKGEKKFYGIDINKDAIKSSTINSNIFGLSDKTIFKNINFNEEKEIKEINKINFDVIFANPPFINSKHLNESDLGNNDLDCKLIKNIFKFASNNLKKNGNILIFYSDLGEILELNEKDLINKLCDKYNFLIKNIKEVSFNNLENKIDKSLKKGILTNDPLLKFKNQSKIYLYTLLKNN